MWPRIEKLLYHVGKACWNRAANIPATVPAAKNVLTELGAICGGRRSVGEASVMTVGELIAVLQGMPPDLPVLVSSFEVGYTEHFDVSMDIAAEDLAYEPELWWAGRFQPLSDCLTPQSRFNAVLVTSGKAR